MTIAAFVLWLRCYLRTARFLREHKAWEAMGSAADEYAFVALIGVAGLLDGALFALVVDLMGW